MFKLKTTLLPSISKAVITIVKEISEYYSATKQFAEKLKVSGDKDKLRKSFDSFSRNLSWFIGMTAYKLIKVKDVEKD